MGLFENKIKSPNPRKEKRMEKRKTWKKDKEKEKTILKICQTNKTTKKTKN